MPPQHLALCSILVCMPVLAMPRACCVPAHHLCPYRRAHNFGLNLFWCFWWPASFFIYPFLGRVWCAGKRPTQHRV